MEKLLKEKGYKVTPARLQVLEIFSSAKEPLDAAALNKKLKNKKINEATIYRTLSDFEKSGILRRIDLRKDSVCFELAERHHHHIVCKKCDRIEDFENKELEKIISRLRSSKFKNITEHSLELFGLCARCI